MSTERHLILAALAGIGIVVLGILALVIPNYRVGSDHLRRMDRLLEKASHYDRNLEMTEQLERDVEQLVKFRESELKEIPGDPGIPELMGKLSLPVDGITIRDQEFIAGEPTDASSRESLREMCVPLTVEMDAHFDSVFALVQAAESMRRLVRVSSVRLSCDRKVAEDSDAPMIDASIRLEAVYVPAVEGES